MMQDEDRVILTLKDPNYLGNDVNDITVYIHTLHGRMFSFFNGKDVLKKVIENICTEFHIKKETALSYVKPFIDNNNIIRIKKNNNSYLFPKNLIIENENKLENDYNIKITSNKIVDTQKKRLSFPMDVTLMLNTICYTDCLYCYADRGKIFNCTIPFKRLVAIIDECKEHGIRKFDLMGGEVLLYPFWKDLVSYLVKNNFKPYISTKIPIIEKDIKILKEIGLDEIQISLDSLNVNIISKLLTVDKNYIKRIKKTLYNLCENGFNIYINVVITRFNDDINNIRTLLNFFDNYSNIIQVTVNAAGYSLYKNSNNFIKIRTSIEKYKLLESFCDERNSNYRIIVSNYSKKADYINTKLNKKENFNNRSTCTANRSYLYILPDGNVTICEELMFNKMFYLGNIISDNLETIWRTNNLKFLVNPLSYPIGSICRDCNDFIECHNNQGVCWKEIMYAYGKDSWHFPDPKCPMANNSSVVFYLE